jgi:hypothetical protein
MLIAEKVGKPLYLGEFGWQILRREGSDLPERDKIFKAAFEHGLTTKIAGIAYWHMTNETNPAKVTYFGKILRSDLLQTDHSDDDVPHDQQFTFDVLCPADKTTCGLISSFAAKMTAKTQKPDAPYPCSAKEFLCLGECVDIYTDPENCGSCGNRCQPNNACSLARCLIEPPSRGGESGAGGRAMMAARVTPRRAERARVGSSRVRRTTAAAWRLRALERAGGGPSAWWRRCRSCAVAVVPGTNASSPSPVHALSARRHAGRPLKAWRYSAVSS